MRNLCFMLVLAAFTLTPMGCASSFRAGGPRVGVQAGGAVGPQPTPVVIPPPGYVVPPPPQ
jgi:hypothetical protein